MKDLDHRLRELVVRVAIRTTDVDLFSALRMSRRSSDLPSRVDIRVEWAIDTNTPPRFRSRLHLPVLVIEQFRGWTLQLGWNYPLDGGIKKSVTMAGTVLVV